MSSSFVHLHNHSCYSLLDGLSRIDDLIESAVAHDMPALALTDHGVMFGAIEFVEQARSRGVKPIVGCEVYVADRPLEERASAGAENYHLVLLAENETGYRNLMQLTTQAHLRGFYRKPRVDHALLEKHAEGLVCLSGCASGELAGRIQKDDMVGAAELADWYRQVFAGRYYLELQFHNLDFQHKINRGVIELGKQFDLPMVATNDVHYVYARQARAHEILLCIQTQTSMSDPKRMRLDTEEFYLKSPEQMDELFGHVPGALSNTLEVAERCNLNLSFGQLQFPQVDIPEGQTAVQHLRRLCHEGLARRYPGGDSRATERLDYELSIVEHTGFVDYLLLVHDVIAFARGRGIGVGPGRGSSAGSIAAYCLFITSVDPLAQELSFERFLNPERVTMPDMDLDFADDRRDEVLRYVSDKYGRERVAQIITFGTIGPRAGVRDVGRAMNVPLSDVDRVAKLIPPMCNKLAKAKAEVPELAQLYESDTTIHEVLDMVEDLEGVARHASTHAAGVVIARDPLIEHVPLYKVPKNDSVTTQFAMSSIEKIGLLKMDFLGLRTLTILQRACTFVEQSTGGKLEPEDIPLEDSSIYQLLATGETFGIFQFDGEGMRKAIKSVRPTEFKHVVALNALYRPGPMDSIPKFAACKNGEAEVAYAHPAMEEVLGETFGVVVYQEQVMRLAVLVAGYTMGEGDLLRRAMAKKKPEELAKHREQFISGAEERGTSREVATNLFDIFERFAFYAFPKAHAAAYAMITCRTAWLKANHPREYLAGFMSAERENSEKVAEALAECRRLKIAILPPDINHSDLDFGLEEGGIRFGLSAIKHVGAGAIEAILRERHDGGAFASLEDFSTRVDWSAVNKRVIESMARCGALDSLGVERARILASLDRIVQFGAQVRRALAAGQVSLFGEAEQPAAVLPLALADAATVEDRVAWEQEMLGMSLTRHPVIDAESAFREVGALPVSAVNMETASGPISIGGLVRGLHPFSTRAGQPMATFSLTDLQASIDMIAFSRVYDKVRIKLQDNVILVVDGKMESSDGHRRLMVDAVYTVEEAHERAAPVPKRTERAVASLPGAASSPPPSNSPNGHETPRHVTIQFTRSADRQEDLRRLMEVYDLLQRNPGSDYVELYVRHDGQVRGVPLPNRTTGLDSAAKEQLRRLLGDEAIRIVSEGAAA